MPPEDSDLRTFRSSLRQEAQPDFTLIIGDFSWTVHTKKLLKSTFFKMLCTGNGASIQRNITLSNVEPVLIGHLILWLYTGDYVDGNGTDDDSDVVSNKAGIDINIIMRNGKANKIAQQSHSSPELGLAGAPFPFTKEEETWPIPVAIHAKMYVLAERYGISELSIMTVEELTNELSWNDTVFLPSIEYLFATPKQITNGGDPSNPTTNGTKGTNSTNDDKSTIWKNPAKGSNMFELLVNNTSSDASRLHQTYLADPIFQKVFRENSDFALEVLKRVAAELHDTKDQFAKLNETIETPKAKKGRKKRVASTSLEKEGG
ncbi:hypothetical protein LTR84_007598 [Exophiala bonariae]|uniref:BTB domain-containing protein n=1 Tax=Exophiala bonariae TaxID=1690606 RepID=A0AAV9NKY7_9EURO|nr:hypothetical protein LTR84_007598 [Exophiala bonariae]